MQHEMIDVIIELMELLTLNRIIIPLKTRSRIESVIVSLEGGKNEGSVREI